MSPIFDPKYDTEFSFSAFRSSDECLFGAIWRLMVTVFGALNVFLDHAATSIEDACIQTGRALKNFFVYLGTYPFHALQGIDHILKSHPYLALFVLALVFLGPVLLLVPLIIFEELFLFVAYTGATALHGLFLGGRPSQWYRELRRPHFRHRDTVFHKCQTYTEAYNRTTLDRRPLLVLRVICASLATYVFIVLVISWL